MQIHGMRFIFSFQIIVPFEILNKRQFSVTSHNPRLFPGIKGVTYQENIREFLKWKWHNKGGYFPNNDFFRE